MSASTSIALKVGIYFRSNQNDYNLVILLRASTVRPHNDTVTFELNPITMYWEYGFT